MFYRGEEIEGKIAAKFYYGAPLAGREIRYQLAGGRSYTGTTDDKGEVQFKLPTREFREAQMLPLVVTLPERNLQTAANFFLATQGFSLGVSTVRPVYVAGESFEVTRQDDRRRRQAAGRRSSCCTCWSRPRSRARSASGWSRSTTWRPTPTGKGRVTLRLEKGGHVRAAGGRDRSLQEPVTGQHMVQVSDDQDTVRLRILADQHTYKVGDTGRGAAALARRAGPGPGHVPRRAGAGLSAREPANRRERPADPDDGELAPNFELSVAVMTDPRDAAKERASRSRAAGSRSTRRTARSPSSATCA